METTQTVESPARSKQYRRARNSVIGAVVAGTTAYAEGHDRIPFIGLEILPNIITAPVILGGLAVSVVSGANFFKHIKNDRPTDKPK